MTGNVSFEFDVFGEEIIIYSTVESEVENQLQTLIKTCKLLNLV